MVRITGAEWVRNLAQGETLSFGRGGRGVDVVLDSDHRLHRHCGTVVAGDGWWELHNTGRWLCLRVSSADRAGMDSLRPGESLRVPWPVASVRIHLTDRLYEFTVACDDRSTTPARLAEIDEREGPTLDPVSLDRTAGYFRALVALCEPQLLDPTSDQAATDLQIALRLNRSGLEARRVTGKTVERRLDACRRRFGLKDVGASGVSSTGLERRDARRRLVELALATGAVSPADLRLLAPIEMFPAAEAVGFGTP